MLVIGFYFVFGVSGQFAFSQAALAAVGGYTSCVGDSHEVFGTDTFWVGLLVGVVGRVLLAAGFSLLMRRASEFYLRDRDARAVEIMLEILRNGTTSPARPATRAGASSPSTTVRAEVSHEPVRAVLGLVRRLRDRDARRDLARALAGPAGGDRDARPATVAATLGVPTFRLRVTMFVLGSPIAARRRVVLRARKGSRNPTTFSIELGLGIFVMLIVGGIDSRWGPGARRRLLRLRAAVAPGRHLRDLRPRLHRHVFRQEHRAGDLRDIFFGSLLVIG